MGITSMRVDYTRREHNKYILFVPKNLSAAAMYIGRLAIGKYTHYIIIIIIMHIVRIEEVSVPVYRKRPRQYYSVGGRRSRDMMNSGFRKIKTSVVGI